jgi:hypothetical protein
MAHAETIETYGGTNTLGFVPSLVHAELKQMETVGTIVSAKLATNAKKTVVRATIRDEYLAAMLLSGANYNHFKKLWENLSNLFAMGDDRHPKTVIAYLSMLDRYSIKQVPKT